VILYKYAESVWFSVPDYILSSVFSAVFYVFLDGKSRFT